MGKDPTDNATVEDLAHRATVTFLAFRVLGCDRNLMVVRDDAGRSV